MRNVEQLASSSTVDVAKRQGQSWLIVVENRRESCFILTLGYWMYLALQTEWASHGSCAK